VGNCNITEAPEIVSCLTASVSGDSLIRSDLIMACLDCEAAPVFYQCEQLQLGSSASDFFAKLIAGEFDF
jgi:hypothetical protein